MRVEFFEAQELAAHILGVDIDDDDYSELDDMLMEEYNIDVDIFQNIVQKLFDMLDLSVSPLTETPLIGFGDGNMWYIKKEITSKFINNVLAWMTEGENIKEGQSFKREIINQAGKVEYVLTITKPETSKQKGVQQ